MVSRGLLVRLEARSGKEADVEAFLLSALPLVQREAGTTAWFAVRFGRGEYGIFDVFPDDEARDAHLAGPVAQALTEHADELFAEAPRIQKLVVLANKYQTRMLDSVPVRNPMTIPSTIPRVRPLAGC